MRLFKLLPIVSLLLSGAAEAYTVPTVSSFLPLLGAPGTVVDVRGSGFTGINHAWIGIGHDASFSFISDSEVRITVPADATTGLISILNPAGRGTSSKAFLLVKQPSSVSSLQVINQGGPNNTSDCVGSYTFDTVQFCYSGDANSDFQAMSWGSATAGTYPINGYNIYRNGSLYDTLSAPVTMTGYISGTTLTVLSISGGTTSIANGQIMSGVQLQSNASGFIPGTVINHYSDADTGGGGSGDYAINFTQTVGSPSSPAIFTAWVYQDTQATGIVPVDYSAPETTYTYAVAAVDTRGNEGPQSAPSAYLYQGITYNDGGNFNYSGVTANYTDTAGSPINGPYDIAVTWPQQGGFLPAFGAPFDNLSPAQRFDVGEFKYFVFDLKVTDNTWQGTDGLYLYPVARAYGNVQDGQGSGDAAQWVSVNAFNYATPVVNEWVHFKIPLSALSWCNTYFTGSFQGTSQYNGTLTVTAIDSGNACVGSSYFADQNGPVVNRAGINGSGYITGNGMPANTYVVGYNQSGGVGTYNLMGPNIVGNENVPAEEMIAHGTQAYKFGLQWQGTLSQNVTYYINNIGFTTN